MSPSPRPPDYKHLPPDSRLGSRVALGAYLVICLNIVFFTALHLDDRWFYNSLVREDGWIENFTAMWFFLASLLLVATACMEHNSPKRWIYSPQRWIYLLAAAALLFAAGEEISWGQRVFGWTTPDFLLGLNQQGESNFHNLDIDLFRRLHEQGMTFLCAVTVIAYCCRKNRLFGIPLPSVPLLLGFLAVRIFDHSLEESFLSAFVVIEYGLLVLLGFLTLTSRQPKWLIVTAVTTVLGPALWYAYDLRDSHLYGRVYEVYEYLLGLTCLLYALELLLAQRRQRIGPASPDTKWEITRMPTTLLLAAPALAIISGGLAVWNQSQIKTEADHGERSWQLIDSGKSARLARSYFDFHVIEDRLVYLREPCARKDVPTSLHMNVHVVPIDIDDLNQGRKRLGYEVRDHFVYPRVFFSRIPGSSDKRCLASIPMPDFPIDHIRVTQNDLDENRTWQSIARTTFAHPDVIARQARRLEETWRTVDVSEPIIDDVFDVYLDRDERQVIYVRTPCADTDLDARFFLHILPAEIGDLPDERKQSGFDNLDFDFAQNGFIADGQCAAWRALPNFDIAGIRTGQYTKEGRIWSQEIDLR